MSSAMDTTMAYAAAFEDTYIDDDWTRLEQYFADDAVYEVIGGPLACRLEGRSAILAGLKQSLDTLDRLCDDRSIRVTSGPETINGPEGEQVTMGWHASYVYRDSPRGGFPGRSIVTVDNGVIVKLQDVYEDAEMQEFTEWMAEYGEGLSGSYV